MYGGLTRLVFFQVAFDEATDEFAPYFNRQTVPKILITTSDRPRGVRMFYLESSEQSTGYKIPRFSYYDWQIKAENNSFHMDFFLLLYSATVNNLVYVCNL